MTANRLTLHGRVHGYSAEARPSHYPGPIWPPHRAGIDAHLSVGRNPSDVCEVSLPATIDIVCPAFNRSVAIKNTIDSVVAQNMTDWRLLVVSDGSTDDTDEVVLSYADSRVRLIRTERHGHPGGPRNIGLAAAAAPYIAYLDSDDRWLPDHLAVLRREFHRGARLVVTASIGMNGQDEEQYRSDLLNHVWHPDLQLLWALYEPSRVGHVRGLAEAAGGWTTEHTGMEDWDLWLRMADQGERFTTVSDRTVLMYLSDSSRRKTMDVRHRIKLGRTTEPEALLARVRTPEIQHELRAAFAKQMLRFYESKAQAGELVFPAEVSAGAVLARVTEFVREPATPMYRELSIDPDGTVYLPLQVSSASHAARLQTFLRVHDSGRRRIVRRLIDGGNR
ncbi:glycosyltransferase family 2 protein [Micromonospora sp. RL09-050-HVF-A]|uniref:glycosyltransferase family 2 protein n=1 Tax=Micromonospora sp. RL09-050-HVF-A TaxID=1703433 RepID=UPI0027E38B1C|nr:glycosyltransferase family 2 protein [Micromonospora sp. RL09-050-HVF-A]